jgi:hypothetical protein
MLLECASDELANRKAEDKEGRETTIILKLGWKETGRIIV